MEPGLFKMGTSYFGIPLNKKSGIEKKLKKVCIKSRKIIINREFGIAKIIIAYILYYISNYILFNKYFTMIREYRITFRNDATIFRILHFE